MTPAQMFEAVHGADVVQRARKLVEDLNWLFYSRLRSATGRYETQPIAALTYTGAAMMIGIDDIAVWSSEESDIGGEMTVEDCLKAWHEYNLAQSRWSLRCLATEEELPKLFPDADTIEYQSTEKVAEAFERCLPMLARGWVDLDNMPAECSGDLLVLARAYYTRNFKLNDKGKPVRPDDEEEDEEETSPS